MGKKLECGDAAELPVARSVYDSHSPAAKLGDYLEVTDPVTCRERVAGNACIDGKMGNRVDSAVDELAGVRIGGKHSAHGRDDFLVAVCCIGDERVARRRIGFEGTLEYLDCELPPGGIE